MKILTVLNVGYPLHGGAQITHRTFLRKLHSNFGHDCVYVDYCPHGRRPRQAAVLELAFRDLEELKRILVAQRPDVVISALDIQHRALELTQRLGLATVAYQNSFEYCPPSPAERRRWLLDEQRAYPNRDERRFVLEQADAVLVNSEFLRKRWQRSAKSDATVVYPSFWPDSYATDRRPKSATRITGICGYPHKGAEIFLAMAAAFPHEIFLLVGPIHHAYRQRFVAARNIEHLPFGPPRGYLARTKVMLVPSQWAEPFGRVAVEAMASGIPTLVSATGGLTEIAGTTGGAVKRFRSVEAWTRALRHLLESRQRLMEFEKRARHQVAPFLGDASVAKLNSLLTRSAERRSRPAALVPRIELRGPHKQRTAHARINVRWAEELSRRRFDRVELADATDRLGSVECRIHHDYLNEFCATQTGDDGVAVAVRTWDFGPYPASWVEKLTRDFDQLWVYSHWTRSKAVESGIPASRVKVVPLGFDPDVFHRNGTPMRLATKKTFRFLFVGEPIARKGFDVLLAAYREAFRSSDDVCLVLKTHGDDQFYRGIRATDALEQAARDPNGPEILVLRQHLSDWALASLYRACDVGVFPYRAEGFCMPILEAMACGVPCIVPDFGPCLDFCSSQRAYLVESRRIRAPVGRDFAINTLGAKETVDAVDFCEIGASTLADRMTQVYRAARVDLETKGAQAAAWVGARFTWTNSADVAERYLAELMQLRVPRRLKLARTEAHARRRVFETAKALLLEHR